MSNTELQNVFCYINLTEIIANHASKLLWGNGFSLTSEDAEYKKAIKQLQEWNNLDSLFYQDCHIKFAYGYSIVQIDRTKTGRIALNFAQPYAQSRVARVLETEQGASTWSRLHYDDGAIYVKTTYTTNQIRRYFMKDSVVLDGLQEKISKDLELPLVENHNMGVVPVKFMQNLPKKNFFGGVAGDYYPDMTPVKRLQKVLDNTFVAIEKELENNRTRVFLDIDEAQINKMEEMGIPAKKLFGDFIIKTKLRSMGSTSGTPPIEILQGNPVLDKYAQFVQFVIDKAFEGSGYSPVNNESNQKTENEILVINSRDLETTRIKRTLNQSDWSDIFQRCFMLMGLDGDKSKWTFEIKENTIINTLQQLDIDERELAMGITNLKRLIIKRTGVSEEEAEQILTENREQKIIEAEFYNQIVQPVQGQGDTKDVSQNEQHTN